MVLEVCTGQYINFQNHGRVKAVKAQVQIRA